MNIAFETLWTALSEFVENQDEYMELYPEDEHGAALLYEATRMMRVCDAVIASLAD